MGRITQFSANNYTTAANAANNSGDNNLYKEKLVFSPSELGLNGRRPATVVLTERQVETKIFQKYGFDVRDKVQTAMLKLRFDTKESPFERIDWGKGQFVAQLNSKGQYEITVGLREKTLEALSGRLINSPSSNTNNTTAADPNETTASRIGINSADYHRRQIENKLNPSLEGLTPEQKELVADLTQVGLSVVGIFDPTGIADGADAIISIGRGDYWGAGISALGIIPYLGDLAKVGKLPKLLKVVENVVSMAKTDARFAKVVTPLLSKLKGALDNLPVNKLPDWAKKPIESLKNKVDEFFSKGKILSGVEPPKPPEIKKVKVNNVELPATTEMSVQNKLYTYLLNPEHAEGGPKAKWFKEALGFTRDNMEDFAKQIKFDAAKAVKTGETQHGIKYNQVIEILGANGKNIEVKFAWIKNNDGIVRLVSAPPTKR
jgi:predicted DNA-binding protein